MQKFPEEEDRATPEDATEVHGRLDSDSAPTSPENIESLEAAEESQDSSAASHLEEKESEAESPEHMYLESFDSLFKPSGVVIPEATLTETQEAFEQLGNDVEDDRTVRGPRQPRGQVHRQSRRTPRPYSSDDLRRAQHTLSASVTQMTAVEPSSPGSSLGFEEEKTTPDPKRGGGKEVRTAVQVGSLALVILFAALLGGVIMLALARTTPQEAFHANEEWAQRQAVEVVAARSTITNYLMAQGVQEKANYVWNAERVRPLMEKYYQSHPLPMGSRELSISVVSNRVNHSQSELPKEFVLAAFEDEIGKIDDVILRRDGSGFLIDWEASVGYNPDSLSHLLAQRPAESATMRVLLKEETYYNYQFSDRQRFQSYAMRVEDDDGPSCFAFADRESEAFRALDRLFANRPPRTAAVSARMRFPSGVDQVGEILSIIQPHWALNPSN